MTASLSEVPAGHVAAIVTFLKMDRPPATPRHPVPSPGSPLRLEPCGSIDLGRYRSLFRGVGSKWLWFSRLAMDDATLRAAIGEVHVVRDREGRDSGLVELASPSPSTMLIRFLGLLPELAGRGHGRWLLDRTIELAWRPGVEEVRVHTCSLDHPAALPAYLRAGFSAVSRAFESFPDPRLAGLLPVDCAPQVPILPDI